ncbi:unnamed protein product [Dibothriocephalus latus]|uniref:Uncharacterized protein n=1 Tax=Dibothriocephalus latus TaxID=60516 RepID=A0A3P6R215_DIBLA|nr:unnamed protein product [Dibothriocephalus latus]
MIPFDDDEFQNFSLWCWKASDPKRCRTASTMSPEIDSSVKREPLLRSKYDETENHLKHTKILQLLEFCLRTYFKVDVLQRLDAAFSTPQTEILGAVCGWYLCRHRMGSVAHVQGTSQQCHVSRAPNPYSALRPNLTKASGHLGSAKATPSSYANNRVPCGRAVI